MLILHQISPVNCWERLSSLRQQTIYQTPEWMAVVQELHGARPVTAEVRDGTSVVGYFCGGTVCRFGLPMLGSPFPGWATLYMGFALQPEVPRWMALEALERFAFRDLGCVYVEVSDRALVPDDGARAGFDHRFSYTYLTDLRKSEAMLMSEMEASKSRYIRRGARQLILEEVPAPEAESFTIEYYEQLKDVFLKQNLLPKYSFDRVKAVVRHLLPTGNVALLRVRDPKGRTLATDISIGLNRLSVCWGHASYRDAETQKHHPNEPLFWAVMSYWKKRGAELFDWGGEGLYKDRYGCRKVIVPRFCKARYRILPRLRDEAERMVVYKRKLQGMLSSANRG